MPKKKFKRVFSADGISTCCNSPTLMVEDIVKRKSEAVKPSAFDMDVVMRFRSGALREFNFVCSECGKETHILNTKSSKYPHTLTDFMTLKMFPQYYHKIRLTAGRSHYRWVKTRGVTLRQDKIWNVFNPKTGWMFHCLKKEGQKKILVRNHTYTGMVTGPFDDKLKWEFIYKSLDARAFYTWPIDVRRELELHPQKPLEPGFENWEYIFTCLRFPALTTLPVASWGAPPRKWRKFLTTETRRTEVLRKVFNNPTKKIIELIYGDHVRLPDLQLACNVFKKENVERLIDAGAFRGRDGAGMDFGWRDRILQESPTSKAIPHFVKEYGEKRLINQMVKAYTIDDPERVIWANSNDLHYLGDSARMWCEIKEAQPDYRIPRDRTLKDVHDRISKEHRRLQTDDLAIPYSEDEWWLNEVRDEVVFTLPLRTHDLTYAGEVLGICVGSYGNGAAKKDYTIVLAHAADDGRILACLQINGNQLTQVKGRHNYMVPFKLAKYITDWAKDHNIKYQHCGDLAAGNRNTKTGLDAEAPKTDMDNVRAIDDLFVIPAVAAPVARPNPAPVVVDVRGFDQNINYAQEV